MRCELVKEFESKRPSLGAKTNEQEGLLWNRDNLHLRNQDLDAIPSVYGERKVPCLA